jgi:leucyl aminopeptidase
MTDFATLLQPDRAEPAHLIQTVSAAGFEDWLKALNERSRAAIGAARFSGKVGDFAILPGSKPDEWSAAVGVPEVVTPWDLAAAASRLPGGRYRLQDGRPGMAALGWLLAQHRFDRYRAADSADQRVLLTSEPAHAAEILALAEATALVRDLVDTPAGDMGPAELAAAAETVATAHGAMFKVTQGAILETDFPMIHAVGRAASTARGPRLLELEWGAADHPRVAIVGKGVCFDTGGLDIKPASGMRLMKKDMGGGAHALALAALVMRAGLPVRLHVLIPAVENAIAGDAVRPGDILTSRSGLTVEVSNTDAEGRLVLADALTRASEEKPVVIIDFATLTGAARVALGPDLPALFTNNEMLSGEFLAAAAHVQDPVWRMPLWKGYAEMITSSIADLDNAPEGGMAGAVTAALFLERFVPEGTAWAHLDTFAWRPSAKPGRPKGGEALGLRAAFAFLKSRFADRQGNDPSRRELSNPEQAPE